MPSDPDDDEHHSSTIIVKNEETARARPWSSSRSPADSMSPGSDQPKLADARAASPRRRLQSPEPLGGRPRRRSSPNRHNQNHANDKNNNNNNNTNHHNTPNGNRTDVHSRKLRSSPAPSQRSHARDSTSSNATGSSHRPPTPSSTSSAPLSNKRPRPNVMTTEERLLAMPEKRAMPWRPGVDPGADIETGGESRRKQIRFGCLLATRGDVVPAPCVSCANGRGKFSVCVADPTLFRGACAGCQLSGRPNRCSIKQGDDTLISPNSTPEFPARNVKKKLSKGHSPLLSKLDHDKVPAWHNESPKWPQQEYAPPPPQQHPETATPQPRWATVNAAPAVQPPAQKPLLKQQNQEQRPQQQLPQQHQQLQQLQQQPQLQQQKPPPPPHTNGATITLPPPNPQVHAHANPIPSRSPMGWATVNQQQHRPHHVPLPSYPLERSMSNGVSHAASATNGNTNGHSHGLGLGITSAATPAARNGTTLPSFPAPLSGPHSQPHPPPQPHRTASREDTSGPDSINGLALIDTLPKTKQRQVYGVISGLQAGIEQLQRELGALKKSLGVGDDD